MTLANLLRQGLALIAAQSPGIGQVEGLDGRHQRRVVEAGRVLRSEVDDAIDQARAHEVALEVQCAQDGRLRRVRLGGSV